MASIEEECGGDDWLVSHMISAEEQQKRMDEQLEEEFDILDEEGEVLMKQQQVEDAMANVTVGDARSDPNDDNEDDEYADMEEFEDDNIMEDEAAATTTTTTASLATNDNIMKVRTYDLSITYDKYYQTPRVWMMGYASADSSQPLTGSQMMQDVMSDYANRTVTIDPHPHVTGPHASIHPCQHGAVMKTIVKNLTKASSSADSNRDEDGEGLGGSAEKGPSVEMYLFIFLKFVSSIIPTINYDFTMDVTASTEK